MTGISVPWAITEVLPSSSIMTASSARDRSRRGLQPSPSRGGEQADGCWGSPGEPSGQGLPGALEGRTQELEGGMNP